MRYSFKEWLQESSGKNAFNRMVMQHPDYQNLHPYVRGEFVKSSFGSAINSSANRAMNSRNAGQSTQVMQPSEFLNNSPYRNRDWSRPTIVQITPTMFDNQTLDWFITRCFGLRPLPDINNDQQRMATQKSKLNQTEPGSNEPIILFQDGDKYKLQEGWHRTMNILLWQSASPEQAQILQQYAQRIVEIDEQFRSQSTTGAGRVRWITTVNPIITELKRMLNWSQWKAVPIKAFIGTAKGQQAPTLPQYMTSTATMPDDLN